MLGWFVETTIVAAALACLAALASKTGRVGPAARHVLWLVVLLKMTTPPIGHWPVAEEVAPLIEGREDRGSPLVTEDRAPAADEMSLECVEIDQGAVEPAAVGLDLAEAEMEGPPSPPEPEAPVIAQPAPFETEWRERCGAIMAAAKRPAMTAWTIGAMAFAAIQLYRMARFADRLRRSKPAPEWLEEAIADEAARFGVRPPAARVVEWGGSPFLWCAGRSVLVIPSGLLGRLDPEQWRGILAHELAHLRRGDPWTCRLALAAGVLWWWNPLYWLVRGRLAAESELACDALAVSTAPEGRRAFAEALVAVCEAISAKPAAPSLGVGAEGRFLERRLTMILKGRDSGRLPLRGLLAAVLLAALAAPSWTRAQDAPPPEPPKPPAAPGDVPRPPEPPAPPEPPVPPPPRADNRDPSAPGDDGEERKVDGDEEGRPGRRRPDSPPAARREIERLQKELTEQKEQLAEAEAQLKRQMEELRRTQAALNIRSKALGAASASMGLSDEPRPKAERRPGPAPEASRASRDRRSPPVEDPSARPRGPGDLNRNPDEPPPPGIRSRAPESREIDRLNRRMDAMEKKLDLLLDELKSKDRKPGGADRVEAVLDRSSPFDPASNPDAAPAPAFRR